MMGGGMGMGRGGGGGGGGGGGEPPSSQSQAKLPPSSKKRYDAFIGMLKENGGKITSPSMRTTVEKKNKWLHLQHYKDWLWPFRYELAALMGLALMGFVGQLKSGIRHGCDPFDANIEIYC